MNEERFKDFAQIAAGWFWELDADLNFTYLSERTQEITGLDPALLLGRSLSEPDARLEPLRAALLEVLLARRSFEEIELRYQSSNEQKILSLSGRPRFDAAGVFLGTRGIGRDVTADRRALSAARGSEDQLRSLLDALPVCIAFVDRDMRYRLNNETYREWFEISPDRLNGERVETVLGKDNFESIKPAIDCALEGEIIEFEETLIDASGHSRDLLTTLVPHLQNDNYVAGLFVLTRDISDQKRRLDRLENSLSQLGAAMDGLDAALVVLDSNTQIRMTNAAWRAMALTQTGKHNNQALVYRDVCQQLLADAPASSRNVLDRIEAFARGQKPAVQDDVLCPAAGPDCWLSISTSEFVDQGERLILVAHRDITERTRLSRDLRDRDSTIASHARLNSLGELAATIAHELNQPLTAIGNYAAIARDILNSEANGSKEAITNQAISKHAVESSADENYVGSHAPASRTHGKQAHDKPLDKDAPAIHSHDKLAGNKTLETVLEHLVRESLRAGGIMNRVNNFVRQRPGEASSVCPASVVSKVAEWLLERSSAIGIRMNLNHDDAVPALWMDASQLEQVLYNLISNAIEAIESVQERSPAIGSGVIDISVEATKEGDAVVMTVVDNGPGMDEALVKTVFEPFSSNRQGGLGLGLAICRSIVERHQGRIWFESVPEGGSKFSVQLPADSTRTQP